MSDIDALYEERSRAYDKKAKYEKKDRNIKEDIRALKKARKKVSTIKHQVSAKRSDAKRLVHVDKWKGNKLNEYQAEIEDNLVSGLNRYHDKTDDIEDKIRSEIARLENESRDIQGIIGDVLSWLNDIAAAIANFWD